MWSFTEALLPISSEQISDKSLVELLRRKYHLAQPYAGAFLKKDDKYGLALQPTTHAMPCHSLHSCFYVFFTSVLSVDGV